MVKLTKTMTDMDIERQRDLQGDKHIAGQVDKHKDKDRQTLVTSCKG